MIIQKETTLFFQAKPLFISEQTEFLSDYSAYRRFINEMIPYIKKQILFVYGAVFRG